MHGKSAPWILQALVLLAAPACSGGGGDGGEDAREDGPGDGTEEPDVPEPSSLTLESIRAVAVTTGSAVLSWYTYVPATSRAEYGTDETYGREAGPVEDLVQCHRLEVTGLSPDTEYHYHVASRTDTLPEAVSEDHVFRTLSDGCETGDAFHVDLDAPEGGDGTSWESAWRLPEEIDESVLGPGDCVYFREGTYASPLRISAPGAEDEPLRFLPAGPVTLTRGIQVDEGQHHVVIRGFEITHDDPSTRGDGVRVRGDFTALLDNYLHHTSGISSSGEGNVLRNNLVHFAEGVAMTISGTSSVLEDNDASHSTCFFAGDADASRFFGEGNTIRDNFFHDVTPADTPGAAPHCDCFQTYAVNPGEAAHDITIENNICFNIGGQMFMGEGILEDDTHSGITFRGNILEGVGAVAMNAGGIRNLVFDHNTFVAGGLTAIGISSCPDALITNNIFYYNPHAYGCEGCTADYNIIFPYDCHVEPDAEPYGLYGTDPYFIAPENHVFIPAPGSPACTSGEGGTHIGAVACNPVEGCHDPDSDGYGLPASALCEHPEEDCDNDDDGMNPGLEESCDGKDNDCDGLRDEDCPEPFPVLELHFEDGVPDSSPSSFDPRWEDGAGSYADGHDGRAAELDGSENGAYVLIEDDPRLCGMGLLTISVWAKKNSDAGGTILLKHVYYTLGVGADTIHAYVQTDEGGIDLNVYHFSDIQDTQWHHYAITYDSRTGLARLLVDGTEVQTGNGAGFVRYDPCDPRDLFIGKDPWGSTFDGLIDELVIHDAVTQ